MGGLPRTRVESRAQAAIFFRMDMTLNSPSLTAPCFGRARSRRAPFVLIIAAVMALAAREPELFGDKVIAAGLISTAARGIAEARARTLLQPVVNATGVLLHTNLGRAPLATTTDGQRI